MAWRESDREQLNTLFLDLVSIQSDTGTPFEKDVEKYIYKWIGQLKYFKQNPEHFGKYKLPDDPHGRYVIWALIHKSTETTILINHHDTVDSDEFGEIQTLSRNPELLMSKLKQMNLSDEVKQDIYYGEKHAGDYEKWIFGRGTADMKAGVALQMMMLKKAESLELKNSVLFLSVPDEENLSKGMHAGTYLMKTLENQFDLHYTRAINSEPYMKSYEKAPIIYKGSAGKTGVLIFARGKKAHIGNAMEGLNPLWLLTHMQNEIEMNPDWVECVEKEVTPPIVWTYLRDLKKTYDVSMPEAAVAYFSVISLELTTKSLLEKLRKASQNAFDNCFEKIERAHLEIEMCSGYEVIKSDLAPRVLTYEELIEELLETYGEKFESGLGQIIEENLEQLSKNKLNLQSATINIVESVLKWIPDHDPVIVIAVCGPLYPHISNRSRKEPCTLDQIMDEYTKKHGLREFDKRHYFTGICDFSYFGFQMDENEMNAIEKNMPGWDRLYSIPLEIMKTWDMELVNIGPWGKDLHQVTERVYGADLFYNTPGLLMHILFNE